MKKCFILAAMLVMFMSVSAQATLLDFNDIALGSSNIPIPVNYGGYSWDTNMPDYYGLNQGSFHAWNSFSYAMPFDQSNYLFNAYGGKNMGFSSTSDIFSVGGWFALTTNSTNPSPFRISLYKDGNLVGTSDWTQLSVNGQYISTGYAGGADRVVFEMGGNGWYAFDNIEINANAVPEPATLLLLGFGFVGLFGAKRKLQK